MLKHSAALIVQTYVPVSFSRTCSINNVPFVELSRRSCAGIVTLSLVQIKLWIVEIELNVLLVHLKRTLDPL